MSYISTNVSVSIFCVPSKPVEDTLSVSPVLEILCSWPFLWSTYQPTVRKTCGKLCDSGLRSQSDRRACPSRSSLSMSACVNCSRTRREESRMLTAEVPDGFWEALLSRKAFLNAFSFVTGDFSDSFRVEIPRIEKISSATSKSNASNDSDSRPCPIARRMCS